MKAIVIHNYGPPDVLKYETVPDPEPRAGEIRIRIHAATVNRVLDVSLRAGKEGARSPVLPLIPGVDCAGVVDAVGPGVSKWREGMRVAAAGVMPLDVCAEDGDGYTGATGMMGIKRPGGFAELVAVPSCAVIALPDGLDFHHAAVVTRHVPTAWNLLFNVAELKAGETVLIMGAGGNLGSIGIQIAKHVIGAKVIAAAGSDDRAEAGARARRRPRRQLQYTRPHGRGHEAHRRQGRERRSTTTSPTRRCCPRRSRRSASAAGWRPPAPMAAPT